MYPFQTNNKMEGNESNKSEGVTMNQLVSKQEKMISEISALKNELESRGSVSDNPEQMSCSVCPSLKLKYEICMQKWYNQEFLTKKHDPNQSLPCEQEYGQYNKCVMQDLKKKKLEYLLDIDFAKDT